MRISDWSSDVCSSDLDAAGHRLDQVFDVALILRLIRRVIGARRIHGSESRRVDVRRRDDKVKLENPPHHRPDEVRPAARVHAAAIAWRGAPPATPTRDSGCPQHSRATGMEISGPYDYISG